MIEERKQDFTGHLLKGVAWVSVSAWLTKVCGFITTIILLRHFNLHEYGTYQLVLSASGLLGLLMISGIDEVFVAEGARLNGAGDTEGRRRLGRAYIELRLVLSAFVFFLAFFIAPLFSWWYSGDVLALLGIYAWTFLLVPFERLAVYHFSAGREFKKLAAYSFVQETAKTVLVAGLLAFSALSITSVLIAMTLSLAISAGLFIPFFAQQYLRKTTGGMHTAIDLLKAQGPWVILQKAIRLAEKNVRPFLVQAVLGREAVALWAFAEKIYGYVSTSFPIDDVLMPIIAHEHSDRDRLRALLMRGIKYTIPFYGILAGGLTLILGPFVHIVFPQYAAGIPLVYVIFLYIPFAGIAFVLTAFYVSHQAQRLSFLLIAARFISSLILLPTLCFFFGPIGAAIEYDLDLLGYNFVRLKVLLKEYPELGFHWRHLFQIDEIDRILMRRVGSLLKNKG